jgi:hypothetical protein
LAAGASIGMASTAIADGHRDHGYRGFGGHHGSGFRVGVGFSTCGSGFSIGFGNGFRYCGGPVYCGSRFTYGGYYYRPYTPIVVTSPYYYGSYAYDYPQAVVVTQPTVVTQPAVVQQPVVIQQPVTISAPAATEPTPATVPVASQGSSAAAAPTQATIAQDAEQNRYRDRELGDAYMRMHDPDNAVRVYKRYLDAWNGDGTVTRNLGLAQVARGDTQEGFRNVIRGYKIEADLIKRPLSIDNLGGKIGFERLLDAASQAAAGTNTAEGWATVALLQHTSGNHDAAVTALQKARDAGLDQTILDRFTLEIGKPSK